MAESISHGASRVSRPGRAPSAGILAAVDGTALLAFVVLGTRSHGLEDVVGVGTRNAVPLFVAWVAVGAVAGLYRRRDVASLLVTCTIAVPVALLVRTWWVGSPQGGRIVVFVLIGLAVTSAFLLLGRGLVGLITRSRPVWRRRT